MASKRKKTNMNSLLTPHCHKFKPRSTNGTRIIIFIGTEVMILFDSDTLFIFVNSFTEMSIEHVIELSTVNTTDNVVCLSVISILFKM